MKYVEWTDRTAKRSHVVASGAFYTLCGKDAPPPMRRTSRSLPICKKCKAHWADLVNTVTMTGWDELT
jgi:hypothetical protein